MDQKKLVTAIKTLKDTAQKRNFKQGLDLIINLKDLDLKKPEHQLDFFMQVHFGRGKKAKVCALVGPELAEQAKKSCDLTITQEEFPKYAKDKKASKKLAKQYDFFIAQANIMAQVASSFGRTLGPRGKMPNPKAEAVIPPKGNVAAVVEKLHKTTKISAKMQPLVQLSAGSEDVPDNELADNVSYILEQVMQHLPGHQNNIKSVFLKLTMGRAAQIGLDGSIIAIPEKKQEKKEKAKKPDRGKREGEKGEEKRAEYNDNEDNEEERMNIESG